MTGSDSEPRVCPGVVPGCQGMSASRSQQTRLQPPKEQPGAISTAVLSEGSDGTEASPAAALDHQDLTSSCFFLMCS